MANADVTSAPTCTDFQPKNDSPNFAAWSLPNLVAFAKDAYTRMQQQQETIEQYRRDLRDALNITRKQHLEDDWK